MRFDDKVALVTGAGSGLGRAYAEFLAARGATVIVNNRVRGDGPSKAQQVVQGIVQAGGRALVDEHAVDNEADCRAMMASAFERCGRVDLLVCNAGNEVIRKLRDTTTLDDFRGQLDVHLYGQLVPLLEVFPRMLDSGYGRIVLTTSAAGVFTSRNRAAYSVAKAGVIGLVRAAASEAAGAGVDVKVNAISPYARTPLSGKIIPEHMDAVMPPEKVAPVVGWLCSTGCTANGEVLAAGAGRVRRQVMVEGPLLDIGDGDLTPVWPQLTDVSEVAARADATASALALIPELRSKPR